MTSTVIRIVAGVCVLLLLAACTAAVVGGAAPGGYDTAASGRSTTSGGADAAITSSINTRYVRDDLINAMDVRVSTYRGVVTLSGRVSSQAAARRAVDLAHSVTGVTQVVSRLSVAP